MRAFIDGINIIRVESYDYIYQVQINGNLGTWTKTDGLSQYFIMEYPLILHIDEKVMVNHLDIPLEIGIVTLTKEFDAIYRYDGPLGYVYQSDQTSFYLYTPVAKEVNLVLGEKTYPMTYQQPIWTVNVLNDCKNLPYHYEVRLVDIFKEVKDPYTISSSTTDSYVIDWNETEKIIPTPIKLKRYVDAVIYEGHVRDLTIALDVEPKGVFDSLLVHSKKLKGNVLDYIKKLGMTHLQLLPVYDFEGVFDLEKDQAYNWGYNPSQYFAVEGWFSKDPFDPIDRINAFKKIINYAHSIHLGVNMDVVYNHVYNHKTFPYDDLVPGYFYRHNDHMKMTDASFCGNDVETRRYMVRRLIIDSLSHFAKNFQIDGFRFDLMGLLDVDTMLNIQKKLKEINPEIMLYGEGWNMMTEVPSKLRSNMANQKEFKDYAHFNDFYRNTMKGELHGPGLGYTMGNMHLQAKAMEAIIGSPHLFESPNQSINYVECHDNLTYYDKMLLSCGYENPDFKVCQDFANHLIAISQGVPFYHAGQEVYRSKMGIENSYNSPDEINKIIYDPTNESVKKLKKLLKIRKKYSVYRSDQYNSFVSITKDQKKLLYILDDKKYQLIHYIKHDKELEKLPLHEGKLIFPSQKVLSEENHIFVDQPGIYIIHIIK